MNEAFRTLVRALLVPMLAIVFLASAAAPATSQEGGLDPRDSFSVSSVYGEAWGTVSWHGDIFAEVSLSVSDTRYDGWCAVVVTYPVGPYGEVKNRACGVGTSSEQRMDAANPDASSLKFVTFTICGYYPPSGRLECGETDTRYNPNT